jgi:hypothetical protein
VLHYNTDRPHQALDTVAPVMPADRFPPVPAEQRAALQLWLPATLNAVATPAEQAVSDDEPPVQQPATSAGEPVDFARVVPASGNLMLCRRQFWMGTHRAGMVVRVWADCDLIHLMTPTPGSRPCARI